MPIFLLLTSVIALIISIQPAEAFTSSTLNFQGRLLTDTGALVPDGSYNIEFNLYDVDTAGTSQWTETRLNSSAQGVTVTNGFFSVYLGDITAFPNTINWDQELWLGMTVRGTGSCAFAACTPTDAEMTPRFQLTALPYAFRAGALADSAGNAFTTDDFAQLAPSAIQAVNDANAAIRFNQAGSGGLLQLQGNGFDVFTVDNDGATTIGAGLTLGDSTSTTAGTIRWTGTDFEGYNGTDWVSLTTSGIGATISSTTATFYDSAGGATITAGAPSVINLNSTLTNTDASIIDVASDVVTVTEDGIYEISYQVTSQLSSGTRSGFNARLQLDTGSGFTNVAGGQSFHYGRITTETMGTSSATVTLELDAGDSLRLEGQGTTQSFTTVANATSMTVTLLGEGSGGGGSTAFQQNGNAFGVNGVLGTTDANGLDIITNGSIALSIDSTGAATLNNGLSLSSGSLNLGSGDITNTGNITGSGALTLASGGAADLTLDSASNVLVLADDTLRRTGTGVTTLDLQNSSGSTALNILNSDGGQVANLSVEGSVTGLSFSGDGSNLTDLDAAELTSGTVADGRLSANVALLDGVQSFSGTNTFDNNATFSSGLTLGNSALATAGNIRWTGTDFEGYNGTEWVSLTLGGGGVAGAGANVIKTTDETITTTLSLQDDDELFFPVGANQTWTFDFVVQSLSGTTPDIQFAVTAPAGSVCAYGYEDSEGSASGSQFTCGASTGRIEATGAADTYRISGTVTTGVTAGNVQLQWSQATSNGANTTVYAGSYVVANEENGGSGGLGGGGGGDSFEQGGNSFGVAGLLGTTDTNGLNIITNGTNALTFTSGGEATFTNDLTVDGGLDIDGDITAQNGLTISSGTFADLTLSSASGDIILDASQLQRAGSGTTGLDLLDAGGDTTFSIFNSDGTNVANLIVEGSLNVGDITSSGSISATSLSGNGAGIIGLDASNIATGTLADGLLSTNVGLLDTAQTFSALQTFTDGIVVGNSVSTSAGAIRWTGTDFEGYNGTEWVSLTTSASAPLLEGVIAFGKYDGGVGSALNEEGATITKNGTGDYTVTFDTAASNANYTIQLTVDEPAATLDDINISADVVGTGGFDVDVREGDNGGAADVRVDRTWNFIVFDADAVVGGGGSGGGGLTGNEFVNGGNAFGGTAQLGTTDANGLRLFTNSNIVLDIDALGDATFTGSLDTDGLLTVNNGLTVSSGSINVGSNGITNAGAVAGVTTLDATGLATVGGLTTTGTVDATTVIADFLTATNAITAPTTGNTINGLIINAGALDGISGYNQTSGNFTLNGTGTFTTGTGDVTFNGDVTAATNLDVNNGLAVNGTDIAGNSRLFIQDSINVGTGVVTGPGATTTYTFDSDGDPDEAAWTFEASDGANGLNPANSSRQWSHDTDDTTSVEVGPTSGQGGVPDGYIYTEASGAASWDDVYTVTNNSTFDASTANWVVEFYWNQRGDINLATLDLQTNENGAGWVTRASFGGGDQATGGPSVWNFESIDLTGVISDASTEIRFVVTFPSDDGSGLFWHNDFGLDTITIREDTATSGFVYSDNLIEGYNASTASDVDLLSLRSDVGETENVVFRVDSDGDVFSDGVNNIAGGADIAENYLNNDGAVAGDVVYFTDNRTVAKTSQQYQVGLAGVVSTDPGVVLDASVDGVPVGLKGRLPTKVSVANGNIKKGDYLTSGPDGRAVKATQTGTVIGMAMEDANDEGMIDVFVGLTYYVAGNGYGIPTDGLEFPQQFTDIDVDSVSTDGIVRLTRDGELLNINGITLLAGGIDNNFTGIRSVGNVLGAWTVEAQNLQLRSQSAESDVLEVFYDNNQVFTLGGDGSLGLRVTSENALSVTDENGEDYFSVNTDGGVVQIGSLNSDASTVLFLLARKNSPGDPVGVNGAQYYNEYLQKFRCHEDGEWVDCVTSVLSEYIVTNNVNSWVLPTDETELPGSPQTWLDLRKASEYRVVTSVSDAAISNATCSVQYQLTGTDNWTDLGGSVAIDAEGTLKSDWIELNEEVKDQEEVLLRVVCGGGDNIDTVSLSIVRLQVR